MLVVCIYYFDLYIIDNIVSKKVNRYYVFNFNVNENMYVLSKEIKIRMKSIF